MKWFKVNKKATIIATFIILTVLILFSNSTFGKTNAVGITVGTIINVIQTPFAKVGNSIGDIINNSGGIAKENKALKEKINQLEATLIKEKLSEAELNELKKLSEVLNYSSLSNAYQIVTGDVIALDKSNTFNVFTINLGKSKGVKESSVVINGDGLIGKVIEVGENWAKVISIVDETNNVGFLVFRDTNWLGVSQGDGDGGLVGYLLDENITVLEGDRLITSGIGGVYPAGLNIGKVTKVEWNRDATQKYLSIEPAVYFKNIQKVSVLI